MDGDLTVAQASSLLADVQLGRQLSVAGSKAASLAETFRRELLANPGVQIEIPFDWDDDWFEVDDELMAESFVRSSRTLLLESFMAGGGAHWITQPRGKDGKWIYSGVDTSKWNKENSAAISAMKKIKMYEKLVAFGDLDQLLANPPNIKSKKPNHFQKGVAQAYKNLVEFAQKAAQEPPKGAVNVPGTPALAGWSKIGEKLGTEKGGTYIGPDGAKYYVKIPDNPERAHNEILAFKLYELAGGNVAKAELVMIDGKPGVATKWMDDAEHLQWTAGDKAAASEDFALHAWLNNWDAVGAGSENPMDNIKLSEGKLKLVDAGGSLEFSGMGGAGKKTFGKSAVEWDTLRDPSVNKSMATVFGGMTPKQLHAAQQKLGSIKPSEIYKLVDKYHYGDDAAKGEMKQILTARAMDIAGKKIPGYLEDEPIAATPSVAPVVAPVVVKPAVPTKVAEVPSTTATPPSVPPPPTVNTPKNPSAQKKLNELFAAAGQGIAAVEAVKTNAESKQTYAKMAHKYKMQLLDALKGGAKPNPDHIAPKVNPDHEALASVKEKSVAAIDAAKDAAIAATSAAALSKELYPKGMFPAVPAFQTSNAANKKANEDQAAMMIELARAGKVDEIQKIQVPEKSVKMQDFKAQLLDVAKTAPQKIEAHKKAVAAAKEAAEKAKKEAEEKAAAAIAASIEFSKKYGSLDGFVSTVAPKAPSDAKKVGWWSIIQENTGFPKIDGNWMLPHYTNESNKKDPFWEQGYQNYLKLPSDESSALYDYTGSGSKKMNATAAASKASAASKKAIEGAKKASMLLPAGALLSRKYSPEGTHNLEDYIGAVMHQPTLLSTSTDPDAFYGTLHTYIVVGPGVKGVPAGKFSQVAPESEVILNANQRFINMGKHPDGRWMLYALPTLD